MKSLRVLLTLSFAVHIAGTVLASDPRIFLMGVWPNRLRLFDEATGEFIDQIPLRYGAVTSYGITAHSPDYRRLYYVTDRMETVEIVDTMRREVVDEVKVSTPEERVRIFSLAASPDGKTLYLQARGVQERLDRYIPSDYQFIVYDLEAREVKARLSAPQDVELNFFDPLTVSADGSSLYSIGSDVLELDAETLDLRGRIPLSQPRGAGFGGIRGGGWNEIEPGIFYGIYRTTEPTQEKSMTGVVRVDLNDKSFESFELGPAIEADVFALSSDGRYGYAGMKDLVAIDMETRSIVKLAKDFERGRTNNTLIVSADGTKLYVTGVGDSMWVYDAKTFEHLETIFCGADIMSPAVPLPRSNFESDDR